MSVHVLRNGVGRGSVDDGVHRTSYLRRGIGIAIGGAPVGLAVASLFSGTACAGARRIVGVGLVLAAIAVALVNFYLSCREGLYLRAHRSLAGYLNISVVAVFGTLFVVAGTLVGFGSALGATFGVAAMALDTGGSVWFLVATWRDASLWDR